jgi:hypothetical protein
MADSTLAGLTAATAATGGLYYGTQAGADRKFTITAAGATLAEAADALAQKTALSLAAVQPFILAFKNVTVLTAGSPADIATVTLPAWCTRFRFASVGHIVVAETAAGTLAGALFQIQDTAGGAGLTVSSAWSGNASTGVVVLPAVSSTSIVPSTVPTLYLRQTANSANAGTISVYLTVVPLL